MYLFLLSIHWLMCVCTCMYIYIYIYIYIYKPANSSDYPTLSSAVNQTTIRCLINFRCIPARLLALIQWSRSCIQSLKVYNIHMVSVITNMKFVYNETNKLTLHKYHMSRARRLLPAVSDPCGIYVLCTSHWCCIQIS